MLRRLEEKDAPFMLGWMHDEEITAGFQRPFAQATMETVLAFIHNSFDEENQNFAFVNSQDEYLGTISLKHISHVNDKAEYAVVARKCAQGTGAAKQATEELLQYAFEELGLHKVYLSVLAENIRAQKFYEKCGFLREGLEVDAVKIQGRYHDHIWYGIRNCDRNLQKGSEEAKAVQNQKVKKTHHMSLAFVQEKYTAIENWMDKVDSQELKLEAQESEQYGDYDYWDDEVAWEYFDTDKIGHKIEEAVSFARDCINDCWYEYALQILDRLLDLDVLVENEWEDSSIGLEDIVGEKIADVDLKQMALMTLYADYQIREPQKRAEDIYSYFGYHCFRNISIKEMFTIGREELPDADKFWEDWITLLSGKSGDKEAELLLEALLYKKGEEGLADAAKAYGHTHPSLYLEALKAYKKLHKYQDMQKLGLGALAILQKRLTIRSEIALSTAEAAECNHDEMIKYLCWYEAFCSNPTEKNYLRLYSTEKCAQSYRLVAKPDVSFRQKGNAYAFSTNKELELCSIDDTTWNCILFLQGDMDKVKEKCINPKNSLGWTGSFIRCGIKLFMIYLYQGEKATKAVKQLANNLSSTFGYDKIEQFWKEWLSWKSYYPIQEEKKQKYLKWLEDIIDRRTHAIVGGQHRRQYDEVAVLISALGDIKVSWGETGVKQMLMDKYLRCYPRHSSFKAELKKYNSYI